MERLANRYQTSAQQDIENAEQKFKDLIVDRNVEEENPGKREMKRRVSGNLDGKGLVNGIIMSEVLGSPRAKQPYRSIVQKKKIKNHIYILISIDMLIRIFLCLKRILFGSFLSF